MTSFYSSSTLILLLFLLSNLLSSSQASENRGGRGLVTVDLIRRGYPGSLSYDPSISRFDLLRSSIDRSAARKSFLNYRKTAAADASAPVSGDTYEYLMKVSLGNPSVEIHAIADTGSDLMWAQCEPCTNCYSQNDPLFDPSKSSTYQPQKCDSQSCSSLGSSRSCGEDGSCKYQYSYGDNSQTNGDLASETLTIGSTPFPNVAIGCGHEDKGTFSQEGSGLVGLGAGQLSIVSQLGFDGFSYCLTPTGSDKTSTISFWSGSGPAGSSDVVSTPFVINEDQPTFYYLTLEGVTVDGGSTQYLRPDGSEDGENEGNIIIDSGTTLTYLPSDIYEGLEADLVKAVSGQRVDSSDGSFNLCYQGEDFQAPSVVMHFSGGADVVLEQDNTFTDDGQGNMCLTMVPMSADDNSPAIFGNLNQMNYWIEYDIAGRMVNFKKSDCAAESAARLIG